MRMKKLTSLLLVLCLTLALGSITTLAVDLNPEGGFAVNVRVSDNDQEMTEDIVASNIQIDLYKIANVTSNEDGFDTIDFAFLYNLTLGDVSALNESVDVANESWIQLAQDALAAVQADASATPVTGTLGTIKLEEPGLYLMLAHGANIANYTKTVDGKTVTIADSAAWEYSFDPQIVSIPTRGEYGDRATSNTDADWDFTPDAVLKFSREERFGSLTINKTVNNFEGEPATFVFHIVDAETGGQVYDNYASIYFTGGSAASVTVDKVPAGVELTVSEDYSGGRYTLTSGNNQHVTVDVLNGGAVAFTNTRNNSGVGGNGINNNFTFDGGDWPWTPTPAQG